jgi:tetratricopeptide (TPR) repeat protein
MTNILFHLLAVVFVFLIGRRLKLDTLPALLFALLFAIHPLRVESVTWVTERKDVLFGSFYLIALYHYIKHKQGGSRLSLILTLLFFKLSLLSKIQAVILPVSMVLVDYYLDQKFEFKKSVLRKWPYFLLSLSVGSIGIYLLSNQGSIDSAGTTYPLWQRIFIGSYSFCVFIIKAVIPYELVPLYPYPARIPWYFYVSILALPLTLYALYDWYNKGRKVLVFGLLFFIVNIFFLLQILGAGQGLVADRFTYISHLGLYFISAFYFGKYLDVKKLKPILIGAASIIILAFSYMSFQQNKIWKNSGTLWTHVLKHYDKTPLPFGNRANFRRDQGNVLGALQDYNSAIALRPSAQTYNSRARLFFDHANTRDTLTLALNDYNKAIEIKPNDGEFHTNRGATYARLGDLQNALKDLTLAIQYKPDHTVAYLNRSIMYKAQGQTELALNDLSSYVQLNPYNGDIWYEKGSANFNLRRFNEALHDYIEAIKLNPNNGLYYYGRSKAYYGIGNTQAAIADFKTAQSLNFDRIDPSYKAQLGI